jgi:protein phosphatase
MQFSVYQESHIGGRKVNQDRMGYSFTRDALLLVLADGMGGHLRGEIAASVALQPSPPVPATGAALREEAAALSGRSLAGRAPRHSPVPPRAQAAGDAAHHHRRLPDSAQHRDLGALRRLAPVLDAQWPDPRPHARPLARGKPDRQRHGAAVRTRHALGPQQAVELPRRRLAAARRSGRRRRLLPGDLLLLCSDGLWSMLPDDEILRCMQAQTVVRAVPDMLQAALRAAGDASDNVTALAIMWQGSSVLDNLDPVTET